MSLNNNKNQINNLMDVLIIDAVATSCEKTNQRACIYKYVVEPERDQENLSIFRKYCSWNPFLFNFIINIVALLLLVAIGFAICIGISSAYPKLYGDHCAKNSDCDASKNLVCDQKVCGCRDSNYYDGSTCANLLSNGDSCLSSYQCGHGLYCNSQYLCQCQNDRFWSSALNYCVLLYSYGAIGCKTSNECGQNMTCSLSTCSCLYPFYFDGNFCSLVGTYLSQCEIQAGCDQTKGLSCSLTNNDIIYVCLCSSLYYWSQTLQACINQLKFGQACVLTTDCRVDLGLYCDTSNTNDCICSANFYWTGSTCGNLNYESMNYSIRQFSSVVFVCI